MKPASRTDRIQLLASCLLGVFATLQVHAADDADALSLQVAPEAETRKEAPYHLTLEAAAGNVDLNGGGSKAGHRGSIDFRYSALVAAGWRFSFSDRLDDVHPVLPGQRSTLNSLRETYVGWLADDGASSADLGRVNLRNGPAYGWNPTDYFRTGALRVLTTVDPVALRELRQGTFMLRLGHQWGTTGLSVAVAPKLATTPDDRSGSLDLASTNFEDRLLVSANARLSDRVNAQALVLAQRGASPKVGGSLTALVSDAAVVYVEASTGRVASLADSLVGAATPQKRYAQGAFGLTYTLPTHTSVTLEAEYNGSALDKNEFAAILARGADAYANYLGVTQRNQELGFRRAWLVYVAQKDIGIKQLDLAALVRINAVDHSRLGWVELRYHWNKFDAAIQWQRTSGQAITEFGTLPFRQVLQLVGDCYF